MPSRSATMGDAEETGGWVSTAWSLPCGASTASAATVAAATATRNVEKVVLMAALFRLRVSTRTPCRLVKTQRLHRVEPRRQVRRDERRERADEKRAHANDDDIARYDLRGDFRELIN